MSDDIQWTSEVIEDASILTSFGEHVAEIRQRLSDANIGKHVSISLYAAGYPAHGDFEVSCTVRIDYGTIEVSGTDIDLIVNEAIRRYEFNKNNNPKLLPKGGDIL